MMGHQSRQMAVIFVDIILIEVGTQRIDDIGRRGDADRRPFRVEGAPHGVGCHNQRLPTAAGYRTEWPAAVLALTKEFS